jgi:hypothetical protein
MPPHPLQAALDRVTVALYTSTDLMEIAQTRKAPNGRSDVRQASRQSPPASGRWKKPPKR